jgi:MFS superfamily sulfate permease-like transporter
VNEDNRPVVITIPTELDRSDAFIVLSVAAAVFLGCWWALQTGFPVALVAIVARVAGAWMLTSRSATEVRFIGSIAVFLRNKLGERDAHEWVLAFAHYVRLVHVPRWQQNIVRYWKSIRQRLSTLHR